jgi:hypothetical protein
MTICFGIVSYALDRSPIISRLKNENRSLLLDAPAIEALERVVTMRMRYYKDVRWRSSLDNRPPPKWLECWLNDVDKEHLP